VSLRRVTIPQLKRLIRENGKTEVWLFPKGKDPNHNMTYLMETQVASESDIKKANQHFDESTGGKITPWYAVEN
jgi:hypothetical protein